MCRPANTCTPHAEDPRTPGLCNRPLILHNRSYPYVLSGFVTGHRNPLSWATHTACMCFLLAEKSSSAGRITKAPVLVLSSCQGTIIAVCSVAQPQKQLCGPLIAEDQLLRSELILFTDMLAGFTCCLAHPSESSTFFLVCAVNTVAS